VQGSISTPDPGISAGDAGIWADRQIEPVARISRFIANNL
jgi:hypothetical protein